MAHRVPPRPSPPALGPLTAAATCWSSKHDAALTRCLRYIKGTKDKCLIFRSRAPLVPAAWADASFGNDLHPGTIYLAKSRSGVLLTLGNGVITAKSRRISASCLSTAEAEISALSLAVRLLLPIRDSLRTLLRAGAPILPHTDVPPVLVQCDNQAVISTVRRGHLAGRMRHCRIELSFLFDALMSRDICLAYCPSPDMRANFLTKSEPRTTFQTSIGAYLVLP